MTSAIQLSSKSNEWYGPKFMGDLSRQVMGGIDMDPCSCEAANRLIGARFYYSKKERGEDGLLLPWAGRIYCNPPGKSVIWQGVRTNSPSLWWAYLVTLYQAGWVEEAIFTIFNLETVRFTLRYPNLPQPFDFPYCIPKERIGFYRPDEAGGVERPGSPGHPNAIIYLGPNVGRFAKAFTSPDESGEYGGGRIFYPEVGADDMYYRAGG